MDTLPTGFENSSERSAWAYLREHRLGLLISAGVLLSIPIAGFIVREILRSRNTHFMQAGLKNFHPIPDEATYSEAKARSFGGTKKPYHHAVLLLHGYSSSPQEFDALIPLLQAANIPYYAPSLTGYGLDDFRLLYQIQPDDWRRDAAAGFEFLSSFAEEVSVAGHSTGANLALYVASKYPVRNLILSAANLAPSNTDLRFKNLINSPLFGSAIRMALPVFRKPIRRKDPIRGDTLDPASAGNGFSYRSLPLQSLRALWKLQDETPVRNLRFKRLDYLYGMQDMTVDNQASINKLKKEGYVFNIHVYNHSAHNILEDYEKAEVTSLISSLLAAP
ncbi:MAG: alpha/beta fold hydrolase [Anaerolineaceae bacterium]